MTGYLITFVASLILGYYLGNRRFRRAVNSMFRIFSQRMKRHSRYDDDDYED